MPSSQNIIEQHITDTLEKNFLPYAMSVIVSRAIPEIDGFKPSHRKLLYTMYKMGLLKGSRRKSADVVGQTMQLNPHGDAAIYETMVRLTRGYDALLHAFVDSKGNFGKVFSRDMAYAASRYTEVKLTPICEELFNDIEKNTVDFIDNYNGTMQEPVLFPTTFPNVLVTQNQGIAVGMASSISSFNLKEVVNATIAYINNKDVDIADYLLAPDFSTGGELLYDKAKISQIYDTGRGSVTIRGKYRYDKKNSCIEIYEVPYTTTCEAIIDKIVALVKSGKLKEINDIRDETDLNGLKITIDIKKSSNPEMLMNKLYQATPLSDTFSCNFNILVDSRPVTMGIKGILDAWLTFRIGCIKRGLKYDLVKNEEKLHLLVGLSKIMLDIDKAISIIRETEKDSKVIPNLMEGFDIDKLQAEFIAEIRLRNLNREYLLGRVNEREKLEKAIEDIKKTLESDAKVHKIIENQLKAVVKTYGKDRLTDIVYEHETPEIDTDALIDDYALKVFLTKHNYFKKISLVSLRGSDEQNLKEDDEMLYEIDLTNKSELLFFSNKQNVYKAKTYDMPDCKASSLGEYLPNLLDLEPGELILYMAATYDYSGYMLFFFNNGKLAKINMDSYQTKVNRKRLVNAFSDKAGVVNAIYVKEDCDFVVIRDTDKAALLSTGLVSPVQTKASAGVQIFTLKKNSTITKAIPVYDFMCDDPEYYRVAKIPSTGHFIKETDKKGNNMSGQIRLF
ncbi:MAG: topoisomerase IV [Clostridiales bacterium]|jgi:DNA gyrase subunit A|nr:topoisomerase IV [Clostridiales bacterium]